MSGIYLESWFSWLGGGVQKNIEKKNKTDKIKPLKNEEKVKRGLYFARKQSLKKKQFIPSHLTMEISMI